MNRDTPLVEVVGYLSKHAAADLDRCSEDVQVAVLEAVRAAIAHWERIGISLDPVAFEAVVSTLVASLASAYSHITVANAKLFHAQTSLAVAEAILANLVGGDLNGS